MIGKIIMVIMTAVMLYTVWQMFTGNLKDE
jgi:hypothetical protein